jgi:hypothetical protein
MNTLGKLNPIDISYISVVKPKKAKKQLGDKGADGAVYITAANAAKRAYWNFFRNESKEYKQIVNSPDADLIVQYVLNGQALTDQEAPVNLHLVTKKLL